VRKLNPDHIDAVINLMNRGPFYKHLSMAIRELGLGYSLVELELGTEHLNPFGGLHGGVYASVIDTAAYWAVYGDLDEKVGYITLDLRVDFLAPVKNGKIIVKGRRIKIGKTIGLAEATALDQKGKWLAHGLSKVMVLPGTQSIEEAAQFLGSVPRLPPKFIS
jgi:uncharacterized protein (TIGR00369 family)